MKQTMINMTRCAGRMLHTVWKTLKQMPFMCMVRTNSPSQRTAVTACGPMPLWNGGLVCADMFQ